MCRPVACKACNKTTWAGCGQHVEAVKASVPRGQWCTCTEAQKQAAKREGSLLGRLFG